MATTWIVEDRFELYSGSSGLHWSSHRCQYYTDPQGGTPEYSILKKLFALEVVVTSLFLPHLLHSRTYDQSFSSTLAKIFCDLESAIHDIAVNNCCTSGRANGCLFVCPCSVCVCDSVPCYQEPIMIEWFMWSILRPLMSLLKNTLFRSIWLLQAVKQCKWPIIHTQNQLSLSTRFQQDIRLILIEP